MSGFVLVRDRDASATIRGYVYQVDQTILRWLELRRNQVLELERGEDIDVVRRAVSTDEAECSRLLEQVKHRRKSITLRSPEAVEALANALEHQQANPDLALHFRFATNAPAGRERLSPLPDRQPGLLAWQNVRDGKLDANRQSLVLAGIRTVLTSAQRPEGLPDETWAGLQDFLKDADESQFCGFVLSFEWGVGQTAAELASQKVRRALLDKGRASDDAEAQILYQRLFLCVLKLLGTPGIKRLSPEELDAQCALPSLGDADQELLENVVSRLCALEGRVGGLESLVDTIDQQLGCHAEAIQEIQGQIPAIFGAEEVKAAITYVAATPDLGVPPTVVHLSRRTETVRTLEAEVRSHAWTAFQGSTGTGKTHLAILLGDSLGGCRAWIRLRDLGEAESCLRLDTALASIAGMSLPPPHQDRYGQLLQGMPENGTIVLDDLPALADKNELSQRLLHLASACRAKGILLLSTSFNQLPASLLQQLGDLVSPVNVPLFTNEEAGELLIAHGAPDDRITPKHAEFLNMLAQQHPTLLTAIAQFLHAKDWRFTIEEIEAIFRGEHTPTLVRDVIATLLANVEDQQTRELLYRLTLIMGDFTIEDVRVVAEVAPGIDRPDERLNGLLGLYVQEGTGHTLSVSPLVGQLGGRDLFEETRKATYVALGAATVRRRRLDQLQAVRAITYYLAGGKADQAGLLLMMALHGLNEHGVPEWDAGLTLMWSSQPLPESMNLGIRMLVRTEQMRLPNKTAANRLLLANDLLTLIQDASETEGWATFLSLGMSVPVVAQDDVLLANRLLEEGLPLLPGSTLPNGEPLPEIPGMAIEEMIWFTANKIQNPGDLRSWLRTLESLSPDQRERAFGGDLAEEGSKLVTNRCWFVEADKPQSQRDWDPVLQVTTELVHKAQEMGLELLWACGVRVQIIIHAEYRDALGQARSIADEALSNVSEDPRVRFLIEDCIGRQYVYVGQPEEALNWLDKALSRDTEAYPGERVFCLLNASRAASDQVAVDYCRQAVQLARSNTRIPDLAAVKAFGEHAIVSWIADDRGAAFDLMDEAGQRLLACADESLEWKDCFVMVGHALGYMASSASTGSPPAQTESEEAYVAPYHGMLLTRNDRRLALYDKSREFGLHALLAMFAEAVGKASRAADWALSGFDAAERSGSLVAMSVLAPRVAAHLLLADRYEDGLSVALDSGRILVAVARLREKDRPLEGIGVNIEAVLGPKPGPAWEQAESWAGIIGLIPAAFRLAQVRLANPEEARDLAISFAYACKQMADVSICPDYWRHAAVIVETAFAETCSAQELIRMSNESPWKEDGPYRVLCYVAACVQEDAGLGNAFKAQMAVLPYVFTQCQFDQTVITELVVPFVCDYWSSTFNRERFRFRSPRLVEQQLAEALDRPASERAQAVLVVVRDSLGVTPIEGAQEWLNVTQEEP